MNMMSPLSSPPEALVQPIIERALAEDFGSQGDVTSDATIPKDKQARAVMRARTNGVVSGIDVARRVFESVDPSLIVHAKALDGDKVSKGNNLLAIEGSARSILMAERVALNLISHMSGIASATADMVASCAGTNAQIADTRKTTPSLRVLEKYAVRCGGGVNHRFGLDDAVLIKDNHIAVAGGVEQALNSAKQYAGHMIKIEIEVDTMAQLDEVLVHGGADIVMLDNFSLEDAERAVTLVDGRMVVEFSGTVTLDRIPGIAKTGVDIISSGWLTHSAPALDIGLDIDIS